MTRLRAALGSVVFLLVAPGVAAGLVTVKGRLFKKIVFTDVEAVESL